MVRDPKSEVDMGIQCLIIIYILITHILYKVVISIEERKIIPNTNGRYYATKDGHIYDTKLKRNVAENESKRGWLKCHIWYNEKRITINVHRLIAYAYFGISDLTVNHKDGNKHNNSVDNLEYMTLQEQNWHRSRTLHSGNQHKIICIEQNKIYNSAKEFCEIMGFDYSNCHISEICKPKYGFKTYKGYHFEYINNYEREEDIEKID